MNKYDIVEKIKIADLIKVLFVSFQSPYQLLQNQKIAPKGFIDSYFNWGRNALYYWFKSTPFSTVTFPAFTCPTLTEAAEKAGKKVVLVEADKDTFNMEIDKIPANTECLVVVHTFGNPVDISKIRKIFPKIFIIEDCAHALFAKINNKYVGSSGDAVLFSLYKQIANINGALLLTKTKIIDKQLQESDFKYLKRLIYKINASHQYLLNLKRHKYLPSIEPQDLNSDKPSSLVYKLFNKNFKKLEREVTQRKKIASLFYQQCSKVKYYKPQKPQFNSEPSFYHFAIRLESHLMSIRDKVIMDLRQKNIFLAVLWPDAPIAQEKYKHYQKLYPNALQLAKTVINLPIYSWYTKKDITNLFNQLNQTIKNFMSNS